MDVRYDIKIILLKIILNTSFPLVHLTPAAAKGVPGDGDGVPGDPDGDEAKIGGTTLGEPVKTKRSLED